MIRESGRLAKDKDIKTLCQIVRDLLYLDDARGIRGTIGFLAEDFTGVSSNVTITDLLQVWLSSRQRNNIANAGYI